MCLSFVVERKCNAIVPMTTVVSAEASLLHATKSEHVIEALEALAVSPTAATSYGLRRLAYSLHSRGAEQRCKRTFFLDTCL